MVSISPVI